MRLRVFTVFLLAVLLLTGCNAGKIGEEMNSARSAVEKGADAVMDAAVSAEKQMNNQAVNITREEAQTRALNHAGFTADQVTGLRTEYEIDDGIPRYEVQFRQGRWEYDYEINANTGEILSYDRDD